MTDVKKKVLQMSKKGLKPKEISEKINADYKKVRYIVEHERIRQRRVEKPELYRDAKYKRRKNARYHKNKLKNKDRLNARSRELVKSRKLVVVEHYSARKLKCNCCGVKGIEFLTIDHIMPRKEMEKNKQLKKIGYKALRRGNPLCQWLITNNFPKGFQILCWNCNTAKGILGMCPHQK